LDNRFGDSWRQTPSGSEILAKRHGYHAIDRGAVLVRGIELQRPISAFDHPLIGTEDLTVALKV
jgi:hypothetical protein